MFPPYLDTHTASDILKLNLILFWRGVLYICIRNIEILSTKFATCFVDWDRLSRMGDQNAPHIYGHTGQVVSAVRVVFLCAKYRSYFAKLY